MKPAFCYVIDNSGEIVYKKFPQTTYMSDNMDVLQMDYDEGNQLVQTIMSHELPDKLAITIKYVHGQLIILGVFEGYTSLPILNNILARYETKEVSTGISNGATSEFMTDIDEFFEIFNDRSDPTNELTIKTIYELPNHLQDLAMALLRIKVATIEMLESELEIDSDQVLDDIQGLIELGYIGEKRRNDKKIYFIKT